MKLDKRMAAVTGAGSGLGRAIAPSIVEAHGGQIAVVEGGRGGHFKVTLPHESASTLEVAAGERSAASASACSREARRSPPARRRGRT